MDLSPAEEVVVELLRGEPAVDFTLTATRLGEVWTVSITTETDGILAGKGDTFRRALHAAFGVERGPHDGEEIPTRPALSVVGGTDRTRVA